MISIAPSLRQLRFFMASLMLALVAACGVQDYSEYRFRMTVEVDTPEGLRTGSSVYQVSAWNTGSMLPDASKRGWNVQGDAVAVDLPNGQMLFALLKTSAIHGDLAGLSMTALDPSFNNDVVESAARLAQRKDVREFARVEPKEYPMLVRFRDIADPKTVELVEPDSLSAVFGDGYGLRRITIAITDDEVATGIKTRLAWLADHTGTLVYRPREMPIGEMPKSHRLTGGAFYSGE